jgi:Leucine-rich repeat (LRR) protein
MFTSNNHVTLVNLTQLTFLQINYNKFICSVLCGNELTGSIPVALANLTQLTYLDLSENKLTGSIPVALANLTKSD